MRNSSSTTTDSVSLKHQRIGSSPPSRPTTSLTKTPLLYHHQQPLLLPQMITPSLSISPTNFLAPSSFSTTPTLTLIGNTSSPLPSSLSSTHSSSVISSVATTNSFTSLSSSSSSSSTSSSNTFSSSFTWLVFLDERWTPFDNINQIKLEQTLSLGGTFVDIADTNFPHVKRVRVFPRTNYLSYLGVKYRLSRIMQPDAWLDHS